MMTKKIIKPVVSAQEAVKCIKQGDTIMVGGSTTEVYPTRLSTRSMKQGQTI